MSSHKIIASAIKFLTAKFTKKLCYKQDRLHHLHGIGISGRWQVTPLFKPNLHTSSPRKWSNKSYLCLIISFLNCEIFLKKLCPSPFPQFMEPPLLVSQELEQDGWFLLRYIYCKINVCELHGFMIIISTVSKWCILHKLMIPRGKSLYQSRWKSSNMKSFIRKARWHKEEGMMIRVMGRFNEKMIPRPEISIPSLKLTTPASRISSKWEKGR